MRRRMMLAALFLLLSTPRQAHAEDPPVFITKWGTYGTGPGQFIYPSSIAVDRLGNVYVVDPNRVQKFSGRGGNLGQFGGLGPGNGLFKPPGRRSGRRKWHDLCA